MRTEQRSDPKFIQVMNERGLVYLRRQNFGDANVYTLKVDRSQKPVICIGRTEHLFGDYEGHSHIVRCADYDLRDQAEAIVRSKLKFAPRQARAGQMEARP